MKLLIVHVIDFIHANIFRHWPYWACYYVMGLWPDEDHSCWFCKQFWSNESEY